MSYELEEGGYQFICENGHTIIGSQPNLEVGPARIYGYDGNYCMANHKPNECDVPGCHPCGMEIWYRIIDYRKQVDYGTN